MSDIRGGDQSPDWVKLWNFRTLEDGEFLGLLGNLESEINSHAENDLRVYFHKLALMIFFSKNSLSKISFDEIKDLVYEYVDKYRSSDLWKNNLVSADDHFNGTGYAYFNFEDTDFIELKRYIAEANKSTYDQELHQKRERDLDEFIESLKLGKIDYFNTFLLDTYELKPILHEIDSSKVADALRASDNKVITEFGIAISERYSTRHFINGTPKYALLKKELEFWESLKNNFPQGFETSGSIRVFLLKSFLESTVMKTITLLSEK